jgi:hypothetical protein
MGGVLDHALRTQPQALSEGKRLGGAFREHRGRFLGLDEVGSHGLYASRMQIHKLFVIHWSATFTLRLYRTIRYAQVTTTN